MAILNVPVHFDCASSHKTLASGDASGIFSCKFPRKMALVICPCAFRLCKLAQNGCRRGVPGPFAQTFPSKMDLMTRPCACRLRSLAQNGVPGGVRGIFSCKFTHKLALMTCPCAFPLCRLAQNETSHTEILPRRRLSTDLAKRPLMEILLRELAKRHHILQRSSQQSSYRDLVKILPGDLSSRSCTKTW